MGRKRDWWNAPAVGAHVAAERKVDEMLGEEQTMGSEIPELSRVFSAALEEAANECDDFGAAWDEAFVAALNKAGWSVVRLEPARELMTCEGPRDCVGTERGCIHCDPFMPYRVLDGHVAELATERIAGDEER